MPEDASYIIKRKDPLSSILLPENRDELARFFDEPFSAIIEAITGALAAGPTQWLPLTGRIVQGILAGKLFQQISREIKDLREKGKIADNFAEKEEGYRSWVELMRIIDEEAPEGEKLEALRALFYAVNRINAADGERILNYQLFQIAKRLNSGELLLLRVAYDAFKDRDFRMDGNPPGRIPLVNWLTKIAKRSGHGLTAMVERNERAVVAEGLLSPRLNSAGRSDMEIVNDINARLTDLGLKFCETIEQHRSDLT